MRRQILVKNYPQQRYARGADFLSPRHQSWIPPSGLGGKEAPLGNGWRCFRRALKMRAEPVPALRRCLLHPFFKLHPMGGGGDFSRLETHGKEKHGDGQALGGRPGTGGRGPAASPAATASRGGPSSAAEAEGGSAQLSRPPRAGAPHSLHSDVPGAPHRHGIRRVAGPRQLLAPHHGLGLRLLLLLQLVDRVEVRHVGEQHAHPPHPAEPPLRKRNRGARGGLRRREAVPRMRSGVGVAHALQAGRICLSFPQWKDRKGVGG